MMLKILVALLIVILFVLVFVGYVIFSSILDKKSKFAKFDDSRSPEAPEDNPDDLMAPTFRELYLYQEPFYQAMKDMEFEDLTIKSFDGLNLHGQLLRGTNDEVIICVHGYKSSKEIDFCEKIPMYINRGSNILLVDDRCHGLSEGRYIGFSELDKYDVAKWVKKINEMFENPSIYLHGVSMGGATVIHMANMNLRNVKGIIDDCGFNSIRGITKALMTNVFHVPYFPLGYIAGFISKAIGKIDFDASIGEKIVAESKYPIVFIHGDMDKFVPSYMSESMYEKANCPKRLLLVKGAGHAASYMKDKEAYEKLVYELLDGGIK